MKLTNEEKCVYCREYGNLPCDECNKKLEEKKAMNKLEERLRKYFPAIILEDKHDFTIQKFTAEDMIEFAETYAKEVAIASLEKASELPQNLYDDEWHLEKLKESITNPDNILIL